MGVTAVDQHLLQRPAVRRHLGELKPPQPVQTGDLKREIVVHLGARRRIVGRRDRRNRRQPARGIVRRVRAFELEPPLDGRSGGQTQHDAIRSVGVQRDELCRELALVPDAAARRGRLQDVFTGRQMLGIRNRPSAPVRTDSAGVEPGARPNAQHQRHPGLARGSSGVDCGAADAHTAFAISGMSAFRTSCSAAISTCCAWFGAAVPGKYVRASPANRRRDRGAAWCVQPPR